MTAVGNRPADASGDAPASTDIPECLECGACCFGDIDAYIRVTGDDHARLGDDASQWTHFVGNQMFMKMETGHCKALDIAAGQFVCAVYARRPEVCRSIERLGPQCTAEHGRKHGRTRRVLAVID